MPGSISFTYEYGKYTYFSFPNGNKVTYAYEWEDPVDGDGAPLPAKVVKVFHELVRKELTKVMKGEDTTVAAIRNQLALWDANIDANKIKDPKELQLFVDTVNASLAERCSDKFANIEGGIMPIIRKAVWSKLDQAVQEKLKKDRWRVYAKIAGKVVVAVSAIALSIVATVFTAGAAAPLVAAAVSGAVKLGQEAHSAWKEYKSAESSMYALAKVFENHAKACDGAAKTIKTAETQLYVMKSDIARKKKSLNDLSAQIDKLVDTLATAPSKVKQLTDMEGELKKLMAGRAEQEKNLREAEAGLKQLETFVDLAKDVFSPGKVQRPPDSVLKKAFAAIEPFAPWADKVASIVGSTAKLIQKFA